MKRNNYLALASVFTTLGGVGVASAQSSYPVGVSLRAGIYFPTSSNLSGVVGTTWFGFGADYSLLHLDKNSDLHPTLSFSADYFSRNSVSEIPIVLNYVVHKDSVFGSIGAGAAFDHTFGSSVTKFAYEVGIGYDLPFSGNIPVFLEAKYFGQQDSYYNGVGVFAGVRF